ncbi:MAG: gephyrin-like molybdotransferase Glp [Fuerstiella sp.]
MISVDEAVHKILTESVQLPAVKTSLRNCTGLILAENTRVGCDSPPFDKAMMDGFAVSSQAAGTLESNSSIDESANSKIHLKVIETITAGIVPQCMVDSSTASRIMTGAPMPAGADCVIPIERVDFDSSTPTDVGVSLQDLIAEKHVLRRGVIAVEGDPLMSSGVTLQAQHIAALAEFGMAEVPCVPQPKVAVLATGDELVDVSEPLTPGRIRNSNEPMLLAQLERAGSIGYGLGIAEDQLETLKAKVSQGLSCDVLLLSGGVSAGMLDLVPQVLTELGVCEVFHKVAMKPGKPLWFGQLKVGDRKCLVFGLPGNPVSSMVCFEVFVRPALQKLAGIFIADSSLPFATLQTDIAVKGDRVTYFPATFQTTDLGLMATALPWAGSADLRTTAAAEGLVILDPKQGPFVAGSSVECMLW